MSNFRFNLRLTEEAKRVLDQVKQGEKNKFINNAIETYGGNNRDDEILSELQSISKSLNVIAECLQEIIKVGGLQVAQAIPTEKETSNGETTDNRAQKKLADFALKYVEL